MRADPTRLAARPLDAVAAPVAWLAWAGATALWTAFAVAHKLHSAHVPLTGKSADLIVYGLPAALAVAMILDARLAANRPLQLATAWSALVVAALLATHLVDHGHTAMVALPALAGAALVFARRPALALALAFAMSGFYGTLIAVWHFPTEKMAELALGGLAAAVLWNTLVTGRDYSIKLGAGLVFTLAYIYVTIVDLLLETNNAAAGRGFMTSAFLMLALPVIALAGWRKEVHERIAKGIVLVSLAVGLYAVFRFMTHPAVAEYVKWGGDPYNYVGGKFRLIASFGTGQDLGGWTAIVIPFCLAMAVTLDRHWRWISLAAAVTCAIGLVGSQERISLAAVALGALAVIVLHEASQGFAGRKLGTTGVALLAMIAIGFAAFGITGGSTDKATHSYSALLRPLDRSDPSVNARLYKWEVALRDLRPHPFGHGLGTANLQSTHFLTAYQSVGQFAVDNGFLNVALEQGFAIMAIFALAVILVMIDLFRNGLALRERLPAGITIGAFGSMVAAFVMLWAVAFQDGPRALPIWIIAGLGLAQFTTRRADG